MRAALMLVLSLALAPAVGHAQAADEYVPSTDLPSSPTRELVLVFFSTSECVGNREPELGASPRAMKRVLAARAAAAGESFSALGAAAEWSISDGLAYLLEGKSRWGEHDFGAWDEVQAGRNWLASAALDHVWRDPAGAPTVPQVILLEREVGLQGQRIVASEDVPILRLLGSDEITGWVRAGMPLP